MEVIYLASMGILEIFITIIPVLVNVAFLTLLERKVLGYIQLRKGPNKVSMIGLLQPFADAVKLFLKELVMPYFSVVSYFVLSPVLMLFLVLMMWALFPLTENSKASDISVLIFMMLLSLNVYPLFFSGWSSNSKYAMIGAVRGIAQAISYEISLALIMLSLMTLMMSSSFYTVGNPGMLALMAVILPLCCLWMISCVAETNRSPFDFSEGESELVSGFNIEYGGVLFTLLFLSEYAMILLLSFITGVLFVSGSGSRLECVIFGLMMVFIWIWLRGTFPRFRYDKLMNLGWKVILPSTIVMLMYILGTVV